MSTPTPATVTSELELRLVMGGDRTALVPCRLSYAAESPYELQAEFRTVDGLVTWVFARDLVRSGLDRPVGDGDVVVWPSRGTSTEVICLALSSPSGRALLEADRAAVAEFVQRTDAVVAPGSESDRLDLDGLIEQLLADDPWGPESAGV